MRSSPLRHLGLLFVVVLLLGGVLACDVDLMPSAGPSQPTITLTAPTSGAEFQVGEEVDVLSSSSDAKGVMRVELYVDRVLYRTDPSPIPSGSPQMMLVQTWIAEDPGTHTLSVVAVNVDGMQSDHWAVTVRVVGEAAGPWPSPTTEGGPVPPVTSTVQLPPPADTATVPPPTATSPPPTATSPPPTATLDPNAPRIKYFTANGKEERCVAARGERVTLSWEWERVDAGYLDPGNVALPCPAMPCSFIVVPEGTTTYTIRAINSVATTKASVTVEIGS